MLFPKQICIVNADNSHDNSLWLLKQDYIIHDKVQLLYTNDLPISRINHSK